MTTISAPQRVGGPSLVVRIAAELRPEFSGEVIFVDLSDPIVGGPVCKVGECDRIGVLAGMCKAHHLRWVATGRSEPESWASTALPNIRWLAEPPACSVVGCRRARDDRDLCHTHLLRWRRQGCPDQQAWFVDPGGPALRRGVPCRFRGCGLDAEGEAGLCRTHRSRWIRRGRPSIEDYLLDCEVFGRDCFDLRRMPLPMRIEVAYAIQRRVDERRTKTRPDLLHRLLVRLPDSGATSILDRSPAEWTAALGFSTRRGSIERRFLLDAIGYVTDLIEGVGWDAEYPRDVWLLRRIGYPGRDTAIRFDAIGPMWLRALTKRWARWRLSTGIGIGTVVADVRAITLFAQSCPSLQRGPEALTREQIEAHLAHLAVRYPDAKTRTGQIGTLAGLLRAARQHCWEPRIDGGVDIYREDYPRRMIGAPRALSETVMAQLELEDNLARFRDPRGRLIAMILMATGLRVGDACRLLIDCITRDEQGAPYLRYTNHKMRRDAFVPIGVDLAAAIGSQQQRVLAEIPSGTCLLPRPTRNPDGHFGFSPATFRGELAEWLRACDVRDELGQPVHVTPHQWRHTFGTRLINNNVPQETVRRLLDHSSHQMTSHYARLSDRTIRDQWEQAVKVDVAGKPLAPNSGPLAEAVWMKNNLARAQMALPNGYCALPLQRSCEYANACLTCPMFVTTAEFLPEHRRQLDATRTLIERAEQHGQQRVAEMNRTVEKNLLSIITTLDRPDICGASCISCDCTTTDTDTQQVGDTNAR